MEDDVQLLRRFAQEDSEAAFAEIVRRHIDFVHSAALRRVGGDAHAAADVTQQVFTTLARRAAPLARGVILPAWLYVTTRNIAVDFVRAECRRRARELEAHAMNELGAHSGITAEWARLQPLLDETMDALGDRDRKVVLLRFFARQPFAEIGRALNLSEDAVRMRVARALDKLHALLRSRGYTSSAAVVATVLESHAVATAPAGLATVVSSAAAGASMGTTSVAAWFGGVSKATFLTCSLGTIAIVVGVVAFQERTTAPVPPSEVPRTRNETRRVDVPPPLTTTFHLPVFAAANDDSERSDSIAKGRAFLEAYPQMHAVLEAARNRTFEQNWGRHLRAMRVPPSEFVGLREEVLRAGDWTFRMDGHGWSYSAGTSPEDTRRRLEMMTGRLYACLGEARTHEFKEAFAWSAVYDFVRATVVATHDTESPLTTADTTVLAQTVARHGRRSRVINGMFAGVESIILDRRDWNVLARELAVRFAPDQLKTMRHVWAASQAQHEHAVAEQRGILRSAQAGTGAEIPREDPDVQAHELAATRSRLSLRHASFYRELKLTAPTITRFEAALIDHEGRMRDIRSTERTIRIDPTHAETREAMALNGQRVRVLVDSSIAALRREEEARSKAELLAVLGRDGYARWQQYLTDAERREFVFELAGRLALTLTPLTAAQGCDVMTVLRDVDYQEKAGAENNDWNAILARTKLVLSESQFCEMEQLVAKARSEVVRRKLMRLLESSGAAR
jgi:RNA polymerase sigma factor (sigma-70 family)